MQSYNITVVGAGYVGLSIATLLSASETTDNTVTLVDILEDKVEQINNRISPIDDEYIKLYFELKELKLKATIEQSGYIDADYVIVATPTNYDPCTKKFDTQNVEEAIYLASKLSPNALIVIKSTIPVGFVDEMRVKYCTNNIVFSPEFLREGKALYDNLYPSRIVIGFNDNDSEDIKSKAKTFGNLLKSAAKQDVEVLEMNIAEAESVKLFANTYLAARVAFFNELDTYCSEKNLNTKSVILGVSLDPRIGNDYNNPSFGYGGYCLPKDTKQLVKNFEGVPQNMMSAIVISNDTRKDYIVEQIRKAAEKNIFPAIGFYKLAMKANSDNSRESAILDIIKKVTEQGKYTAVLYEPSITEDTFNGCMVVHDLDKFKSSCELIVANRIDDDIKDIIDKVYTRDIFNNN